MIRSLARNVCAITQVSRPNLSSMSHLSGSLAVQNFHSSVPRLKATDRRAMLQGVPKPDEGTDGETRFRIDPVSMRFEADVFMKAVELSNPISPGTRNVDIFPTAATYTQLFNGIPFNQTPICNIRVSKNNAIFTLSNHEGVVKLLRSNGMEGFKNARKGTNIAGQATAISFSMKAQELGFKTIRVKIQGLGPGRMSSIKGLQMGGMDIISITDDTRISWKPPRPRKARRL